MPARTFGAAAVATALVLLPTAAHAAGPQSPAPTVVTSVDRTVSAAPLVQDGVVAAGPSDPVSTRRTDSLVVLGLVTLVGGAVLLVLTGRRPDDDEPAD